MRERLEYAAAWCFIKFLGVLPRPMARWVGARLCALLFPLRPALRRAALFNLHLAFPEWPPSEAPRVLRLMVRNLGWMAAEFAHFPGVNRENVRRIVDREGFEHFAAAEGRGKGVLLLGGHMGCWELMPVAHALYDAPLTYGMRPIDNFRVDALIKRYRTLCGNHSIPKNQSARAALRVLRAGGVFGVLADQNTVGEECVFADFFGIPAATTSGVARLARHTGAAVVPIYTYWDAQLGKYRLCYEPEVPVARTEDEGEDVRAATTRFNKMVENYCRRFPDQWLWVHRRWRHRPPGEEPIYPDEKKSIENRVVAPRAAGGANHSEQ